jgi:hypothetical protein
VCVCVCVCGVLFFPPPSTKVLPRAVRLPILLCYMNIICFLDVLFSENNSFSLAVIEPRAQLVAVRVLAARTSMLLFN